MSGDDCIEAAGRTWTRCEAEAPDMEPFNFAVTTPIPGGVLLVTGFECGGTFQLREVLSTGQRSDLEYASTDLNPSIERSLEFVWRRYQSLLRSHLRPTRVGHARAQVACDTIDHSVESGTGAHVITAVGSSGVRRGEVCLTSTEAEYLRGALNAWARDRALAENQSTSESPTA